jgi:hypothetical protein
MRLRVVVVLLLPMMIFCVPAAAALIEGQVVDASNNEPLAGVQIEIEASGRSRLLSQTTSDAGQFSINPTNYFTADELDTYALILTFFKVDYRSVTRVLRFELRGHFRHVNLPVKLENLAATPQIDPKVLEVLRRNKSRTGTMLYMVPYMLESESQVTNAKRINRTLKFHLKRGINTHLQSLETDTTTPEVGITTMPVEIETGNTEQIRAYGKELNALAVVSGMGFVDDSADGGAVNVSSEYVIIPAISKFQPNSIYVDDHFPLKAQASRLFERLHRLWGQNTVLALSLVEIKKALKNDDRSGLERALDYLNAEKKQVGPNNDALVKHIDALMTIIKEDLQP